MEEKYRCLFRDVSPSIVIVEQVGRISYFCIGSVILSEDEGTFILTQSAIMDAKVNINIRFSDSTKQPATLYWRAESLCILKTQFHSKCKPIQFSEGNIGHLCAAAIAPATKSSVYNLPGRITEKSFALSNDNGDLVKDKEKYFIFDCIYGDESPYGVSRLASGPVFGMDGKVLGIIIGDLKYLFWPKSPDKTHIIHKDYFQELGFRDKLVIYASHVQDFLRTNVNGMDWKNGCCSMVKTSS